MTTTSEEGPRPLALLGCLLLGCGLSTRLLVPASSEPMAAAVPAILLAAGAGVVLLEAWLHRVQGPGIEALFLLLPLVPGFFPVELAGLIKGGDFLVALLAGLALRHLARHEGLASSLLRALCSIGVFVALLALSETLYQREELRAALGGQLPERLSSDMGRAFLASNRAASSFINPNTLAGFLLLILPFALLLPARKRWRQGVAALFLLAFAATRSWGAGLAAGLALLPLLLARPPLLTGGIRRLAVIAGSLALLLALLLAAALALDLTPEALRPKLASFGARVDYHRQAFRLLPRSFLLGSGFEGFGPGAIEVQRPGETWSHHVHDSWLELLIACGVLSLAAGLLFARRLRSLLVEKLSFPAAKRNPGLARSLGVGVLIGAFIAPVLAPMLTLFPLGWAAADSPLANALVCSILVAISRLVFTTAALEGQKLRLAAAFALFSALIHNGVDFDLHNSGYVLAFAAICACSPLGPVRRGIRSLNLLFALIALILPALLGLIAIQRSESDTAILNLEASDEAHRLALETLTSQSKDGLPDTKVAAALMGEFIAHERWEEADLILAALPKKLRSRPHLRGLEAQLSYLRARPLSQERGAAIEHIGDLIRPGERLEAQLRCWRQILMRLSGDPRALSEARAALDAARSWELSDDDIPELPLMRNFLKQNY